MTFISYAQNAEDVILWRALSQIEKGFYIDVGANDPTHDSVTRAFYDRGWRGINIEPMPQFFEKLCRERELDTNLLVAVGAAQTESQLFEVPDTGMSTLVPEYAEQHQSTGWAVSARLVKVDTLSNICLRYVSGPIHFLKIDVEGYEVEALSGMDFHRWRPWIVVVEATLPNSELTNHQLWEHLLIDANYLFSYFDGLNRYYVAHEHPELGRRVAIQPNILDRYRPFPYHDALLRINQMGLQLAETEKTITAQAAMLTELRTRVAEAERTVVESQLRVAEAGRTVVDRDALILSLYASHSWRITAPLRRLSLITMESRAQLFSSKQSLARNLEKALRRAIQRGRRSARLMRFAAGVRERWPNGWGTMMRRIRPLYRMSDQRHGLDPANYAISSRISTRTKAKRNLSSASGKSCYPESGNGISNPNPVVDREALLARLREQ